MTMLDPVAVRAEWEKVLAAGELDRLDALADFATDHIPAVLDHVDELHRALRAAIDNRDRLDDWRAYFRCVLAEVTPRSHLDRP